MYCICYEIQWERENFLGQAEKSGKYPRLTLIKIGDIWLILFDKLLGEKPGRIDGRKDIPTGPDKKEMLQQRQQQKWNQKWKPKNGGQKWKPKMEAKSEESAIKKWNES